MQATNVNTFFQCREFIDLLPKMEKLGTELLNQTSTTQKVADYAALSFVALTMIATPFLVGYAAITFTAVPLIAAAGLLGITYITVSFVMDDGFPLYLQLKILSHLTPEAVFMNTAIKFNESVMNFQLSFEPEIDYHAKEMLSAFCALSNIQVALNELSEAKANGREDRIVRVNTAAKKALKYLQENSELSKENNPYGISSEHTKVLKFLATATPEQIKNLDCKDHIVPMVDYMDAKVSFAKGLSSAI